MIKNHIKIAWRNLIKDRQFTILNLLGLSAGLACTMLIYLWVNDELQVDRFHEKDSRLYQVLKNKQQPDGIETNESMPGLLAATLSSELPEVEQAVAVLPLGTGTLDGIATVEQKNIKASAKFGGRNYFDIFSYKIIIGEKTRVLANRNGIVISDELAIKLFGDPNRAIGKMVNWNQEKLSGDFIVSGVFEKMPLYSSIQFDVLFNYDLYLEKYPFLKDWENGAPATYVVLKEGTDIASFNRKIRGMVKARYKESNATLFIRKYSDQYLYGTYENGVQSGGRIEYVRLFSLIAIFILGLACINFMNLSTAKASRRMKEVGVRKAIGASRKSLVLQYLGESLLLSCFALVISIGLAYLLLPEFNNITGKQLHLQTGILLPGLMIAVVTGLVAGLYPALYLSGFKPIKVLKGIVRISAGEVWIRKGLVTFQFVISSMLIVSVIVIYKQTNFIQTKNLGFNKNNIIHFVKEGKLAKDHEAFLATIRNMRGVEQASVMGGLEIPGATGFTTVMDWEGKVPGTKIGFGQLEVGYDLFEMLGYRMKEGRTFSRKFSSGSTEIIFNESAIQMMGLKEPVGKFIKYKDKSYQVIGVVKDFHFESLYEKVRPCFFRLSPNARNMMVKLQPGKERETIARLQKFYTEFNQGLVLDYKFLDKEFEALYTSENRVSVLSRYFAGLAILISCLGLFGLAAFTAERRMKEIVIRKILGANAGQLIFLLSRDFFKLVIIATVIAFPLAWWAMNAWLQSFAYRINLKADIFLVAAASVIFITLLTISFQTIKAVLVDPVKNLRTE